MRVSVECLVRVVAWQTSSRAHCQRGTVCRSSVLCRESRVDWVRFDSGIAMGESRAVLE